MAITLAITMDQEVRLRELAGRRDRVAVRELMLQAIEPTAAALVEEVAAPKSARARFDHFLSCIRTELPALSAKRPRPNLPVTREEIYLEHD